MINDPLPPMHLSTQLRKSWCHVVEHLQTPPIGLSATNSETILPLASSSSTTAIEIDLQRARDWRFSNAVDRAKRGRGNPIFPSSTRSGNGLGVDVFLNLCFHACQNRGFDLHPQPVSRYWIAKYDIQCRHGQQYVYITSCDVHRPSWLAWRNLNGQREWWSESDP